MKFCSFCGKQLDDSARFCSGCGKASAPTVTKTPAAPTAPQTPVAPPPVASPIVPPAPTPAPKKTSAYVPPADDDPIPRAPRQPIDDFDDSTLVMPTFKSDENLLDSLTSGINRLAGGEGAVRPPLRTLFSQIFRSHKRKEAEEIFICGTETTTPELSDETSAWPKPWLFTRILLALGAAVLMLHLCFEIFDNSLVLPGIIFLGAFMVPIAMFVFFFEFNTPKNISFFSVIKIFLVGGCAALLVTLLIFEVVPVEDLDFGGAVLVGIVEELGKLLIVAIFAAALKKPRYLVNGLLIGAAVGAGFAAFETAGYIFMAFFGSMSLGLSEAYEAMTDLALLRGLLAPGGHIAWAAISGYAVLLANGDGKNPLAFFGKGSFWRLFWIPVACHAVWDMPIEFGSDVYLMQILMTLTSWVVLIVLLGNSLTQIGRALKAKQAAALDPEGAPETAEETKIPASVGSDT